VIASSFGGLSSTGAFGSNLPFVGSAMFNLGCLVVLNTEKIRVWKREEFGMRNGVNGVDDDDDDDQPFIF